jgi:protein SCO1/2
MTIKYIRYGLWALVGLAFMGFIAFNLPQDEAPLSIQPLAGFNQGTHFTLTTHQGESFDSESKVAEGEYALLFFGFTHCPVICPTELQKVAEILDGLPADKADKIHPLFITIDPERDTVETLQNYVPLFHEDIMGLTGTVDDIHKTLDDWKVFYTKVDDPQFTEYTMDHSTYLYLVDHTMSIKALYRMKNTPEQIIESLNGFI